MARTRSLRHKHGALSSAPARLGSPAPPAPYSPVGRHIQPAGGRAAARRQPQRPEAEQRAEEALHGRAGAPHGRSLSPVPHRDSLPEPSRSPSPSALTAASALAPPLLPFQPMGAAFPPLGPALPPASQWKSCPAPSRCFHQPMEELPSPAPLAPPVKWKRSLAPPRLPANGRGLRSTRPRPTAYSSQWKNHRSSRSRPSAPSSQWERRALGARANGSAGRREAASGAVRERGGSGGALMDFRVLWWVLGCCCRPAGPWGSATGDCHPDCSQRGRRVLRYLSGGRNLMAGNSRSGQRFGCCSQTPK